MTYTLELPESVERVLEAAARKRGVAVDALLLDLAAREAASEENAEAARREAVRTTRGKYAGLGPTPEERRQWKDEEIARETAKFEAMNGSAI